jgi:serine/threonine protein kinase
VSDLVAAPQGEGASGTIHRASDGANGSNEGVPAELREMIGAPTRYKVVRRLGAGGMAEVFLCTMQSTDGFSRSVALKVVREAFASMPEFCEMFIHEARLAALLSHPNIVSVFDFNRDAKGRPFLAMEYVHGRDLQALMGRPLPPEVAIFIASEVLRGLGHAHQLPQEEADGIRGIIHRDISPQNILLSWQGAVKVADFGIAKAMSTTGVQSGLKGKPSYMSPEQANADALDGRSDLFSVGIVLWEMLTGERLFTGQRSKEILTKILLGGVPPPSHRRPVPADLEQVTMRLLANDREHRYACASDAIAALVQCQHAPRNGPDAVTALLVKVFPPASQRTVAPSGEEGTSSLPDAAASQTTATGAVSSADSKAARDEAASAEAASAEAANAEAVNNEVASGHHLATTAAATQARHAAVSAAALPRAATLAAVQKNRRRMIAVVIVAAAVGVTATAIVVALATQAPQSTTQPLAPRSPAPLTQPGRSSADLARRPATSSPMVAPTNALPSASPAQRGTLPNSAATADAEKLHATKSKAAPPKTSGSHQRATPNADRPADDGKMIHLHLNPP